MRNIFDQYRHHENRLTHALMSSLSNDDALLTAFVRWATGEKATAKRLHILEQQLPGEEEPRDEDEAERRGLPDGWIHDDAGWALVMESKIESALTRDQLERHQRTAVRRGFSKVRLLALVVEPPKHSLPIGTVVRKWTELYAFLLGQRQSPWARRMAQYMEVLERRSVEDEYLKGGTLTVFTGIPFTAENPYNYMEAKRVLRLALDELRKRDDLKRTLRMDPTREGRPAITGRDATRVWDFLPLEHSRDAQNFTDYPHLTLSIQQERFLVIVTVPNGIKREFRRNLLGAGYEAFAEVFREVETNLGRALRDAKGAIPWVEVLQRRYPTQRSEPIKDAMLEFDLRTAFEVGPVKGQPQWLRVAYEVLSKRNSNVQIAVGASFEYERCAVVHTPEILDQVAGVWIACKPLIETLVGKAKGAGA